MPTAPSISKLQVSSTTQLKVVFNQSVGEGGLGHYVIRYDTDSRMSSATELDNVLDRVSADGSVSYTKVFPNANNLSPATTYFVQVKYVDKTGASSAYSNTKSAATATPTPTIDSISFSNLDHDSVDVSWTDSHANSFRIAWADSDQGNGKAWLGADHSKTNTETGGAANYTANSATISGLEAGQSYYFYIKPFTGTSQNGTEGDVNISANLLAPAFTTSDPSVSNVAVSNIGLDSATITFDDLGAKSVKFIKNTTNFSDSTIASNMQGIGNNEQHDGNSISLTSLSGGADTTWYFWIKPCTQLGGSGNEGAITKGNFTTLALPGTISTLTPTADDEDSISLSWSNSSNATSYDLEFSTDNVNFTTIANNQSGTTFNHTGLTANTGHYYRVRGVNANGNGSYKTTTSATFTAPTPPAIFSTVGSSTSEPNATWNWLVYPGTERIYMFTSSGNELRQISSQYWTITESQTNQQIFTVSANEIWDPENTVFLDNGATANQSLGPIKLKAYSTGNGQQNAYSNFSSAESSVTLPTAPPSIVTTEAQSDEILVEWNNPTGNALTETYRVEFGEDTNYGDSVDVTDLFTTINSFNGNALSQSTTYFFRIKTITSAGTSTNNLTTSKATEQGPDPVVGDNLTLSTLGAALGVQNSVGSEISLGDIQSTFSLNGSVALKDFYIGSVKQIEPAEQQYIGLNQTRTFTLSFNNKGKHFTNSFGTQSDHFTWTTEDGDGFLQLPAAQNRKISIIVTGKGNGEVPELKCQFDDDFNEHSGIPGTARQHFSIRVIPGA